IDQVGLELTGHVVSEPETIHDSGPDTLNHDVGLRDQLLGAFHTFTRFAVAHNTALISAQRHDDDALPALPGPARLPPPVPRRGLHFYNVRPTVRQHHRASGSRGDLGEIDYAYSLQRGLHRSTFYYWNLICVASRMVFQRAASSLNVLVTCSGVPYWGTNP